MIYKSAVLMSVLILKFKNNREVKEMKKIKALEHVTLESLKVMVVKEGKKYISRSDQINEVMELLDSLPVKDNPEILFSIPERIAGPKIK